MKDREKMTETISIRVTPDVKSVLQAAADGERRKLSAYLAIKLEELAEQISKPKRPRKVEPAEEGE
jgi:uncharacterized protein (DUF1778 family)